MFSVCKKVLNVKLIYARFVTEATREVNGWDLGVCEQMRFRVVAQNRIPLIIKHKP